MLVHGVGSAGEWYAGVQRVLGAHFRIIPVYHVAFQWRMGLGPLAAVAEPLVLLAALLVWWSLPAVRVAGQPHLGWVLGGVAVVAAACTVFRHHIAARAIRDAFPSQGHLGSSAVYAVAHSMGTRLLLHVLRHYTLPFQRIVLTGSVAKTGFPWSTCPTIRDLDVRNEVAPRDVVVWLGAIGWRLGGAGVLGFDPGAYVHTQSLQQPCPRCARGQRAPVHNIAFPANWHSDAFVGQRHALPLWLPFFLGIDSAGFAAFHQACRLVVQKPRDAGELRAALDGFLQHRSVFGADTVRTRLAAAIRLHPEAPLGALDPELLRATAEVLAQVAFYAGGQIDTPDPHSGLQRCLDPHVAVHVAVNEVLQREGRAAKVPLVPPSGEATR